MNYNVKLNLLKFNGAKVVESKAMGKGIFIPIAENKLYVTEKGAYADATAWENTESRYGESHSLAYKPEGFEKAIYIGHLKIFEREVNAEKADF